jgi:hypothetical protein
MCSTPFSRVYFARHLHPPPRGPVIFYDPGWSPFLVACFLSSRGTIACSHRWGLPTNGVGDAEWFICEHTPLAAAAHKLGYYV